MRKHRSLLVAAGFLFPVLAFACSSRLAKYNQVLRIEEKLGSPGVYEGAHVFERPQAHRKPLGPIGSTRRDPSPEDSSCLKQPPQPAKTGTTQVQLLILPAPRSVK